MTRRVYTSSAALGLPDNQVLFLKPAQIQLMKDMLVVDELLTGVVLHALSKPADPEDDGPIPINNRIARKMLEKIIKPTPKITPNLNQYLRKSVILC